MRFAEQPQGEGKAVPPHVRGVPFPRQKGRRRLPQEGTPACVFVDVCLVVGWIVRLFVLLIGLLVGWCVCLFKCVCFFQGVRTKGAGGRRRAGGGGGDRTYQVPGIKQGRDVTI